MMSIAESITDPLPDTRTNQMVEALPHGSASQGEGDDDGNRLSPEWWAIYANPWKVRDPLTPRGNTEETESAETDEEWVQRSSAALRDWMDKNPF